MSKTERFAVALALEWAANGGGEDWGIVEHNHVQALAGEVGRLRAALLWYAWPDQYVPRFEGVGAVGQGPAYWSQMDRDIGAAARKALGDAPEDYARQAERAASLIHDAAAGANIRTEKLTRLDAMTDKIRAAIESGSPVPVLIEERAAWARLVKAERDVAMENAPCPSPATLAERDAARQAFRDYRKLGGPMPAPGTRLCRGYRADPEHFRSGVVLVACETPDGWAAILWPDGEHPEAKVVDNVALHVGLWRSDERADEAPEETEAVQRRQRAAWAAMENSR